MALNLQNKQAIVAELHQLANHSVAAIAADYRGLTVSQMTELRVKGRQSGVTIRVCRNTLARKAVEGTTFACLTNALVGPMVLFFSQEDPGAAARLLRDFLKVNETLQIRALVMDGHLLAPEQLKAVASLPTREEALAQLLSVMKAPVVKFVRTVREPVAQFVRVLAAVRDKQNG